MEEDVSMNYQNSYSQHNGLLKNKYLFMYSLIICPWNQNFPGTILMTSCNCFSQLFDKISLYFDQISLYVCCF